MVETLHCTYSIFVVDELQANSQNAIEIIGKSSVIAEKQESSVKITSERFEEIVKAVEKTEAIIENLNISGQSMKKKESQLINMVQRLDRIAEENAASTEQVSAASEEQTASMTEIANVSQGLSALAYELQQASNKFR